MAVVSYVDDLQLLNNCKRWMGWLKEVEWMLQYCSGLLGDEEEAAEAAKSVNEFYCLKMISNNLRQSANSHPLLLWRGDTLPCTTRETWRVVDGLM